jgi:hypothetical protein
MGRLRNRGGGTGAGFAGFAFGECSTGFIPHRLFQCSGIRILFDSAEAENAKEIATHGALPLTPGYGLNGVTGGQGVKRDTSNQRGGSIRVTVGISSVKVMALPARLVPKLIDV